MSVVAETDLTARIERAFIDACLLDVMALKPGNVGIHGSGHGMETADFIRSARVATQPLCAANRTVGERIYGAIAVTRAAVGTNTNLGIVLLAAPLAQAAYEPNALHTDASLRAALERVLPALTRADAQLTFDAIRLANPGGLGTASRHDVREPAKVTLLEAMREAADRDSIARQYVTGYADVVELGVERLAQARARGEDRRRAATNVYLRFLAGIPDSHVARKFGPVEAKALQDAASRRAAALGTSGAHAGALLEWDAELKSRGVNPGTSADLTVAALFWDGLVQPA